jgi:hypothetical protein
MIVWLVILALFGIMLALGIGGLVRTARGNEAAAERHVASLAAGEHETYEEPCSDSGSFDSLSDLRIHGKVVYSIILYGDGSGEYTLSERDPDDPHA